MKKKERAFMMEKEDNLPDKQDDKAQNGERQEPEEDTGSGNPQPEDVPMRLIAVYPILYLSQQYKVGDVLPANDIRMVEAWLGAGTAVWMAAAGKKPKAKPRTAESGLPGLAVFSEAQEGGNLAGKVPQTVGRKR